MRASIDKLKTLVKAFEFNKNRFFDHRLNRNQAFILIKIDLLMAFEINMNCVFNLFDR